MLFSLCTLIVDQVQNNASKEQLCHGERDAPEGIGKKGRARRPGGGSGTVFRNLKRTLGFEWPIMCFTQGDGSGVKSSTPSQKRFYGMWVRFKFRTYGNIPGVAGPGQQCRRSAFSDRPATQIGHRSKKALPVRRFLQTCDGLTADLRRLELSPATSLLSKSNTHGFILDPLM